MNTPLTNGNGGAEPWTYAQERLRTCGRVISLAPDKLAAFSDLADGFGADVRQGYLGGQDVVDRLHEVADAYGLVAAHGDDAVQQIIVEGMERQRAPQRAPAETRPQQARFPGGQPGKVTIETAAALRTMVFPPIRFIVPNYIPEGCTILAGRPKIGKSWLMLDASLAVARGADCLGQQCEAGQVLYLALEDNRRRLQRRITRLLGYAAGWPEDFCYATSWPRASAGGLEQIRQWIAAHDRARLVVVDVLAAFRTARNSKQQTPYEADYAALQELQQIASDTGVGITVCTHTRKSGSDADDPVEKVSGTLGQAGAADTILVLDRDSDGASVYGRGRDLEEVDVAVEFDRATCRWQVLGDSGDVRRSNERKMILAALKDAGAPMTPSEVAAATGISGDYVRQLLIRMVSADEILRAGRGRYAHPDVPL
jgi:AAA domain